MNSVPTKTCDLYKTLSKECKTLNGNIFELHCVIPSNAAPSDNFEIEKSKAFAIVEILEYIPNSVLTKTIISKATGNVSAISFDSQESLTEKISPFDKFIQVIDGKAEVIIDGQSKTLETGQSIIIPAHSRNVIKANIRFKMISTTIKSGYEDVNWIEEAQ